MGVRLRCDKVVFYSLLVLPVLIAFFYIFGLPSLSGDLDFKFYSDSKVYEEFKESIDQGRVAFSDKNITVAPNFAGMYFILTITSVNYFLIFLINFFCFFYASKILSDVFDVRKGLLFFLLLVNPVIFISLFSVNKEAFLIASFSFLMKFWVGRKWRCLAVALMLALLVRWQYVIYVLVMYLLSFYIPVEGKMKRKFLVVTSLVFFVSLLFYINFDIFGAGVEKVLSGLGGESSLYATFNNLQKMGFYFLVFIPKVMQLMFGLALQEITPYNPSLFFNLNVRQFFSIYNLILFLSLSLLVFRRPILRFPIFFPLTVYAVIFGLAPVFEVRYVLPLSVGLALLLSAKPCRSNRTV